MNKNYCQQCIKIIAELVKIQSSLKNYKTTISHIITSSAYLSPIGFEHITELGQIKNKIKTK